MLSRIVAAVGSWKPVKGFRVIRVDAREDTGHDRFFVTVALKRDNDRDRRTVEHSVGIVVTDSQLREMLPDPSADIHQLLDGMFSILCR